MKIMNRVAKILFDSLVTEEGVQMLSRFRLMVIGASLLLLSAFIVTAPSGFAANSPLELVQSGTDRALQIIRSAHSGNAPSLRERRAEILQIVDEYFDFGEMAKRALGRPWKDQSPQKQQEFLDLFKQLLFNNYVGRVETYTDTDERLVYDEQKIEGEYALVKTRVLNYRNTNVQLDYRLKLFNGQWKVYDVVVEGVSLVDNYRGQFNSILASKPFDTFLSQLREKVAEQKGTL
jgi:phospholipid transport system substrate-binding protein